MSVRYSSHHRRTISGCLGLLPRGIGTRRLVSSLIRQTCRIIWAPEQAHRDVWPRVWPRKSPSVTTPLL